MGANATLRLLRSLAALIMLLGMNGRVWADEVPQKLVVASIRPASLTDGYVLIVSSVRGAPPFDLVIEARNPQLLKNYQWHYPKFQGRIELGSLEAWDWRIGDTATLKVNGQTACIYDVVRSRNEYGVALDKRILMPQRKIAWGRIANGLVWIGCLLGASVVLVFIGTWCFELAYDRIALITGKKHGRIQSIRKQPRNLDG